MNPFRSPRSHSPGRPPGKQPCRWRKALATVATVAIAASGLVGAQLAVTAAPAQAAASTGLITSTSGPINRIVLDRQFKGQMARKKSFTDSTATAAFFDKSSGLSNTTGAQWGPCFG